MQEKFNFTFDELSLESIKNILSNNSNEAVVQYVTVETIHSMHRRCFGTLSNESVKVQLKNMRAFINDAVMPLAQSESETVVESLPVLYEDSELFGPIGVRILKVNNHSICLELSLDGKVVYSGNMSQVRNDWDKYCIDDLGSGVSSAGEFFLSLAICEVNDEVDIPEYVQIALHVKKDGTASVFDVNQWSDSETQPYYMFDSDEDGFTWFS